jgi:transcriptional regulator with XRE-family HTH domain
MPQQPADTAFHIGNMLKAYVKKHRISQSGWARVQGISAEQVAKYLKQPDMQVDTLFTICQTLKYNFIKEIAALLSAEFPPYEQNALQEKVTSLEQENLLLRTQVETLKEVLKLLGK